MKRLIKNANSDAHEVFDFLGKWLDNWEMVSPSQIVKMLEENQDCIYNGVGYRALYLRTYKIGKQIQNWNDNVASKESVDESVKGLITTGDAYQSFSKSESGTIEFTSDYEEFDVELAWVIQSNIEGLDLNALYTKYKEQVPNISLEAYERYQEVVATLTDFTVVGPIKNGAIVSDYSIIYQEKEGFIFKGN